MRHLLSGMIIMAAVFASAQDIHNGSAGLSFDLQTGKYCLTVDNAVAVSNACATVEGWSSADPACQRKITAQERDRLVVECSRADAPTLLIDFTLHPTFLELRAGIKNTTQQQIRIKKFEPLTGGIVFPGSEWTEVRTLDAPSGANQTRVTTKAVCNSPNNLLLTFKQAGVRRSLVLGALKTADFTKWVHIRTGNMAAVEGDDPVGRLVEPGEAYMPEDSFYVDAGTANPFEALEKYGLALRDATGAKPHLYDFPTVCAWYSGVWKTPGAQDHPEKSTYRINTSSGLVEEADMIKACGFLNYSRAAVRLVPDNYTEKNPQGWWDDEHWKLHGLYTEPYDTSEKLGKGMHERGCLAFTYIQPAVMWGKNIICSDFRNTHADWLIGKDVQKPLDFSLPVVQDYLRSKFSRLRGSIDGLMVDYCDESWTHIISKGGFADRKMTATAFYRTWFKALRAGLGREARIHERNVTWPNNDLTAGIADSQRTSNDTDKISPDLVSRSGLRWYKNRIIYSYDMDSKELNSAWKVNGWTGTDKDGRRMMLTMAYVAASRLLTANSFRDLSKEVLYDLERTFPYPTEPRSARPLDAFAYDGWPRVYDFAVTPDWHQVTLFNNTLPTREEMITVPLAGDTADGALGLDPVAEYYVYDFWNDSFVGKVKGSEALKQTLRPGEARMLSVRKVEKNPQVLSTSRHIMQGYYELSDVKWSRNKLIGKAKVVAGEPLKIVIPCNGKTPVDLPVNNDLAVLSLQSASNQNVKWSVKFK